MRFSRMAVQFRMVLYVASLRRPQPADVRDGQAVDDDVGAADEPQGGTGDAGEGGILAGVGGERDGK
jgi:hypothetical protein